MSLALAATLVDTALKLRGVLPHTPLDSLLPDLVGSAADRIKVLEAQVTTLQASNTAEVERRRVAEMIAPPPTEADPRMARAHAVLGEVLRELGFAWGKFGRPQSSRHEAYGVLLEEVDELWDEIKKNGLKELLHKEARQVAAMAVRLIVECE